MAEKVDQKRMEEVCNFGEGADCCIYLIVDPDAGIACAKHDPPLRKMLDARKETYRAQGDNCEGLKP